LKKRLSFHLLTTTLSITSDEIVGAFEIATIHNGHPSYFLSGWEEVIN